MATYYSDHFAGASDSVLSSELVPASIGHGRIRYSRSEFTYLVPHGGEVRLAQFKSGDRFLEVYITCTDPATGSGGTGWLGMHKSGTAHDGAVLDNNIFGTGIADTVLAHVEKAGAGSPDADLFRGKPLWEVVSMTGSASVGAYTKDPMEDWDLVFKSNYGAGSGTPISATFVFEVYYVSGD